MTADDELMVEIMAQAEIAKAARPATIDTLVLATELGRRFGHRSVEDIQEQIKAVWRKNGLFWTE